MNRKSLPTTGVLVAIWNMESRLMNQPHRSCQGLFEFTYLQTPRSPLYVVHFPSAIGAGLNPPPTLRFWGCVEELRDTNNATAASTSVHLRQIQRGGEWGLSVRVHVSSHPSQAILKLDSRLTIAPNASFEYTKIKRCRKEKQGAAVS